jgi:hypothetical protein
VDLHVLWQVVKWVLVVLAAGFVGQFGRHLAKLILERRRARLEAEGTQLASMPDPKVVEAELEKKRIKEQAKLEKKRAKAEVKRAKKQED